MQGIDIQRDSDEPSPTDAALRAAVSAALDTARQAENGTPPRSWEQPELCLRIVGRSEIRDLNRRYRGRDKATNVLSFPAELPPDLPFSHLGDVVVCAPVVHEEARRQGKDPAAHWAHMLIHGTLHLLGYDHDADSDAAVMEALEIAALARLGWPCPYEAPPAGAGLGSYQEVAR